MSLLDKVKANVQEAATMAKEGLEELQTKRDLSAAYGDLGRAAFDLVERGELSHQELEAILVRVRKLKAELASAKQQDGSTDEPPA
jgi:hypothetical protein